MPLWYLTSPSIASTIATLLRGKDSLVWIETDLILDTIEEPKELMALVEMLPLSNVEDLVFYGMLCY